MASNGSNGIAAHVRSSESSSRASGPTTQDSLDAPAWPSIDGSASKLARYDKLSKGDVGYGGNAFPHPTNGSPGAAEGLLSKRLRSLGVQSPSAEESEKAEGTSGP